MKPCAGLAVEISAANSSIHARISIVREGGNNLGCRLPYTEETRRRAMAVIMRFTLKKFNQSVQQGRTLVDFDAPWCEPCRAQRRIIDRLKKNYQGKITFRKINIDDNRDIALYLGIQSIPTILLFKEGREKDRLVGLQTKETLEKALKKLVVRPKVKQTFQHASL